MRSLDILLVDDDRLLARALQRGLAREGHEVRVASSADEARRLVSAARPDAVVADLHLGDESGLDLLGELETRFADGAPVALILATGSDAPRAPYEVLEKPFDARTLCAAALRLLAA